MATRSCSDPGDPGVAKGPLELLLLLGDPRGLALSFPRGSEEPGFVCADEAVSRTGVHSCSITDSAVTGRRRETVSWCDADIKNAEFRCLSRRQPTNRQIHRLRGTNPSGFSYSSPLTELLGLP